MLIWKNMSTNYIFHSFEWVFCVDELPWNNLSQESGITNIDNSQSGRVHLVLDSKSKMEYFILMFMEIEVSRKSFSHLFL